MWPFCSSVLGLVGLGVCGAPFDQSTIPWTVNYAYSGHCNGTIGGLWQHNIPISAVRLVTFQQALGCICRQSGQVVTTARGMCDL